MSYFVYVLFCEKDRRLYVGCTSDLQQRITRHENGNVLATKFRRPIKLIHSEQYFDKAEAFNRERFLKSLWGSRFKKKLLKGYLDKIGYNLKS
jgi:putative endonuclease